MSVTYDTALPKLVDIIVNAWGAQAAEQNLFLRDASGKLTFVVLNNERNGSEREQISILVNAELRGYADSSGISVATPEELFDDSLRSPQIGFMFPINSERFEGSIKLVDRRVVGADWLQAPSGNAISIPRLFFVSLKGGVGRSTALCVLASHLAQHGRRVLTLDLDLEAPGLGSMLLDPDSTPKFGILDYLVESNVAEVDEVFIADMLGPSQLVKGRGVVTVIPALGELSLTHPENVLSKIARAYLPSETNPHLSGFAKKVENLIEALCDSGNYDVVLIDARAGLHESTASAAAALRGDTLLFGIDQPQTYVGYRALFSQLRNTLGSDWANRLHFVEARVGVAGPSEEFASNITSMMPERSPRPSSQGMRLEDLRGVFDVDWTDDASDEDLFEELTFDQELDFTYVYESDSFRGFDPLKNPDRLDDGIYGAIFGDFLARCDSILNFEDSSDGV